MARWEDLFRDLEAQLEEAESAELAAEVAERTRRERAALRLVDRLRPIVGHPLGLVVRGVGPVTARLLDVGAQWLLLEERPGRRTLVPLDGVLSVSGVGAWSSAPGSEGVVTARLGLVHALRGISRDRSPVAVVLADGSALTGTIDRVGADFLELAAHAPGEVRRRTQVQGIRVVPTAAVAVVRTA